jgi:hypothetical protein
MLPGWHEATIRMPGMADESTKDSGDKADKVTGNLPISQHRVGEVPSEGRLRSPTPQPPNREERRGTKRGPKPTLR